MANLRRYYVLIYISLLPIFAILSGCSQLFLSKELPQIDVSPADSGVIALGVVEILSHEFPPARNTLYIKPVSDTSFYNMLDYMLRQVGFGIAITNQEAITVDINVITLARNHTMIRVATPFMIASRFYRRTGGVLTADGPITRLNQEESKQHSTSERQGDDDEI